jgi:serine O-acetyltransferase
MQLSISKTSLADYIVSQLNIFFPDSFIVSKEDLNLSINETIDRLDYCFKHVIFERYNLKNETVFNHLYSDHYLMFLWFLSNTAWKNHVNSNICSKLYCLNKSLHSFDCMYDTNLPDIFLIFHGCGTMLGKANYADFFVSLQGCTVGSHHGEYPNFGKGVALTANSSIIGKCNLGDRVSISTRTTIFNKDIEKDNTAFIDFNTGVLKVKQTNKCYAQQFFNVDLNLL